MKLFSGVKIFLVLSFLFPLSASAGTVRIAIGNKLMRAHPSVNPKGMSMEFAREQVLVSQQVSPEEAQKVCEALFMEAVKAAAPWTKQCCAPVEVVNESNGISITYASYVAKTNENKKLDCQLTEDSRARIAVVATCYNALFKKGCPQ